MNIDNISAMRDTKHSNQVPCNPTARHIEEIFHDHKKDLGRITDLSHKVKEGIQAMDSFIQENTSMVCPECKKVCCIDRHAYYNCDDLIYIYALGLKAQRYEPGEDSVPCQFLSQDGCSLERFIRPSGCNWYFCGSLYDSMEKADSAYTDFDASLQKVVDMWLELTSEFCRKFKELTGTEMPAVELIRSSQLKANNLYRVLAG